jgi:hypothetical protein
MKMGIPKPLREEHAELHRDLGALIKSGGQVGRAARRVAERLHPHFVKEEKLAMPPLGLLRPMMAGKGTVKAGEVMDLMERLAAQIPAMFREHRQIVGALQGLASAGRKERNGAARRFAQRLLLHARIEEDVLYPASLLVGEYLKTLMEMNARR